MIMNEWKKPCEVLPEAGRSVLVVAPAPFGGVLRQAIGVYVPRFEYPADRFMDPDSADGEFDDAGNEYLPAGWYRADEDDDLRWRRIDDVVCWMELPALPEGEWLQQS